MSIFPTSSDEVADDGAGTPTVVSLSDDGAGDLLSALSSDTARTLLAALEDEPATAPTLAEAADVSLQTVHYHLDRLRDAGAVEAVDTVYSERGREMRVFAPAGDPLVVVSRTDDRDWEALLSRLLGAVGVLALASVAAQRLLTDPPSVAAGATRPGVAYGIPPMDLPEPVGLSVFLAGLALLAVATAGWWVTTRSR